MKAHRVLAAVVVLCLCAGTVGAQPTLYGVTWGGQLITINPTTGAGTLVGNLAISNPSGISFRGAKAYVMPSSGSNIYEINLATGATINTVNLGAAALGSMGEGDMAFRSDGMGFLSGFAPPPLVRFDVTVPSSTVVAPLNPSFTMDAMAFNAADVLYGITQSGVGGQGSDATTRLFTIDQATAVATLVGPTGLTNTGVGGMSFDSSGNLFAAVGPVGVTTNLYRINVSTGIATLVGNTGFVEVSGIATQGGAPPQPPTPPPPPGGGEGNYPGSGGTGGAGEGSFGWGFGGGGILRPGDTVGNPILLGPFPARVNELQTFNVAGRHGIGPSGVRVDPVDQGDSAAIVLLATVTALLASLALVVAVRKPS